MKAITIFLCLVFCVNCATFDDSINKGHEYCEYMFKKLDMNLKESKWNKRTYPDCVAKVATAYDQYRTAQNIQSIGLQLALMSLFGSVIILK